MDGKLRTLPRDRADLIHVSKVELGVYPLAVKIHGHRHDVHISRSLTIAQQGPFYAVCARHNAQLCCRDSTAAIVMRMERNNQCIAMLHMVAKPLDLVGVDIRRAHLYRRRQVDDGRMLGCRRQHLIDCIANGNRKIQLGAREAFRTVLKHPLSIGPRVCGLLDQSCAGDGNIQDALSIQPEHILSLDRRGTVVKVHHSELYALQRGKGLLDQISPSLCQDLNRHTLWNTVLLYQFSQKGKVMARRGRKAHFNLRESD